MDRLQAVANVRQRPPDDYAHRVIQVRPAHLVFDIDRNNEVLVAVAGWWRAGWNLGFVCQKFAPFRG
jgi:hypothetical protein